MKVFVINLERATERLAYISNLLKLYNINYEITAAIDGQKFSEPEWEKLKSNNALNEIGRELSHGEIACAQSHINIYKKIVSENIKWATILEDDAFFDERFKNLQENFPKEKLSDIPTILIFSHASKYFMKNNINIANYKFHKFAEVYCSHGYAINLPAAKILCEYYKNINHPVDAWKIVREKCNINIYCQVPYSVGHSELANKSDIEIYRKINEGNLIISKNISKYQNIIKKINKIINLICRQKEDLSLEKHRQY